MCHLFRAATGKAGLLSSKTCSGSLVVSASIFPVSKDRCCGVAAVQQGHPNVMRLGMGVCWGPVKVLSLYYCDTPQSGCQGCCRGNKRGNRHTTRGCRLRVGAMHMTNLCGGLIPENYVNIFLFFVPLRPTFPLPRRFQLSLFDQFQFINTYL